VAYRIANRIDVLYLGVAPNRIQTSYICSKVVYGDIKQIIFS